MFGELFSVSKKNENTWDFSDLVDSLRRSVDFSYDLERTNEGEDIPWDGPALTTARLIAGCENIRESLAEQDPEELKYTSKQPDAMDRILTCAIQLGIEQGFRMLMKERYIRRMDTRRIRDVIELLTEKHEEGSDEHHELVRAKMAIESLERHIEDPGIML